MPTKPLSESTVFTALENRVDVLEAAPGGAIPETEIASEANWNTLISDATTNSGNTYFGVITSGFSISSGDTIPANMYVRAVNGQKITDGGGGTIAFAGVGLLEPTSRVPIFAGFANGDITWTGTVYPAEISTELWDTANTSESDRISRATTAFLNKKVKILAFPRTLTDNVTVNEYHHVEGQPGDHLNTLDTYSGTKYPNFLLKSNTTLTGAPGCRWHESPNNGNNYFAAAWHMRFGTARDGTDDNIIVEKNYFVGTEDQNDISGGNAFVHLGNTHGGYIRNNTFDRVHGYPALYGGFGGSGNYAYNVDIMFNTFIGCGSMVADVLNGKNWKIDHNYFSQAVWI